MSTQPADGPALLAEITRVARECQRLPALMAAALDAGCGMVEVAAAAGKGRTTVWRWARAARRRG